MIHSTGCKQHFINARQKERLIPLDFSFSVEADYMPSANLLMGSANTWSVAKSFFFQSPLWVNTLWVVGVAVLIQKSAHALSFSRAPAARLNARGRAINLSFRLIQLNVSGPSRPDSVQSKWRCWSVQCWRGSVQRYNVHIFWEWGARLRFRCFSPPEKPIITTGRGLDDNRRCWSLQSRRGPLLVSSARIDWDLVFLTGLALVTLRSFLPLAGPLLTSGRPRPKTIICNSNPLPSSRRPI